MTAEEVLKIYDLFEEQCIKIWIDGGWAVDALLGAQTRVHQDLDIAIQRENLTSFESLLAVHGYYRVSRDEDKMWDLVLANDKGNEIEAHAFSFDPQGNVIAQEDWNGYSKDSLGGVGTIQGCEVRCVSVSQLVKTHDKNRRDLKETDIQDMKALSGKFGVTFP